MTDEQANEITLLISSAVGGVPEETRLEFFRVALKKLDYEMALSTANIGKEIWKWFPAWAEFKEVYRAQEKLREPVGEQRENLPPVTKGKTIEPWLRRWAAARFYYEMFDRKRDLRPFKEQAVMSNPLETDWMPDDEWVEESERITDEMVRRTVSR